MLNIENVERTKLVLRAMTKSQLLMLYSELAVIEADRLAHQGHARHAKCSVTFFRETLLPQAKKFVKEALNEKAS